MRERDKTSFINKLRKAQEISEKYNLELGNGGCVASILGGIIGELETGVLRESRE